jgi:hypothetical protein
MIGHNSNELLLLYRNMTVIFRSHDEGGGGVGTM